MIETDIRERLRIYMSRSGLTSREVGRETGYARSTINQFISYSHFGTSSRTTSETTERLRSWMDSNPLPGRVLSGKLYETESTREMERLLRWCRGGGWGILYGPAGAQKTFFLETRAAAAATEREPWMALVEVTGEWSPFTFFKSLAAELGAPILYNSADGMRRGVLRALRKRRTPLAIVIDEADLLYKRVDTLQAVRRLADVAAGKCGLLVAGNEQIEQLFEARGKSYMEQWRSRIEQERVRVLGPTRQEAHAIVRGEAPQLAKEKADALIDGSTVTDPVTGRKYVNARRLFGTLARRRRPN